MRFQHVGNTMRANLNISTPRQDSLDKFLIGFCFLTKHLGVNKCLSHTCIIDNYLNAVDGNVLPLLLVFCRS